MKILFVTDNFPPEVNAPASRTYEHAIRWVSDGADVTVITCAPNFPKGQVHDGYRNAWRRVDIVEGIRVVRVKTYITSNEGFTQRILDYLSFMASAFFMGLFEKRPDIIIGTSPQFFAVVGAWLLSIARWRPFVFELRDLWPASIVTVGAMKKGVVIRLLEQLELFVYRRAAAIVSVTESFRKDLEDRGIDVSKIFVVRNCVYLLRFEPRPHSEPMAKELGVAGKFVVAYLGTHGMAHALENVLMAAKQLEGHPEICFLLVGDGARKRHLVNQARRMQLENVVFHESMPKEKMPVLWSVCDVALAHLKDDLVFATVIPSKIFEAFGMGKPVMIVQPDGEAAEIVRASGAGDWVAPEDPSALANAVLEWSHDPVRLAAYAKRASEAARLHSRDRLAREMLVILKQVAAGQRIATRL
jgi:glycosyltransferase involved in cell wall biosynthesis